VSWLNLSLSLNIAQSVIWINVATDLWSALKHRYYHGDIFLVAELQEEFFSTRQGDLSIIAYFTKLKGIWKKLDNFSPIPDCKVCIVMCNCVLNIMRTRLEETYLVYFL